MPVYFIRPVGQRGPVKIGHSRVPGYRLSTIMIWSPLDLEIVATVEGGQALERRIHGLFAASHTKREWFNPSDELDALIDGLAAGTPIGQLINLLEPVKPFRTRPPRSAEWRRCMSYSSRLRIAAHNLKGHWPADIGQILDRWSGSYYQGIAGVPPTADEMGRLEEVLADPRAHVIPWERPSRLWGAWRNGAAA